MFGRGPLEENKKIDVTSDADSPADHDSLGKRSTYPVAGCETEAELIPGSRLVVIDGPDHTPVPGDVEAEQIAPSRSAFFDEDVEQAADSARQRELHTDPEAK